MDARSAKTDPFAHRCAPARPAPALLVAALTCLGLGVELCSGEAPSESAFVLVREHASTATATPSAAQPISVPANPFFEQQSEPALAPLRRRQESLSESDVAASQGSTKHAVEAAEYESEAEAPPADYADAGTKAKTASTAPSAYVRMRSARPLHMIVATAALPAGLLPDDGAATETPREADILSTETTYGDTRLDMGWGLSQCTWSPTNLCHRPLYFEQVNLERHGYTMSPLLQPILSGAHFFATIPALPYKMTIDPPCRCIYTLGYYRPGSCAPRRWHGLPLHNGATAAQAATTVGLILLLP